MGTEQKGKKTLLELPTQNLYSDPLSPECVSEKEDEGSEDELPVDSEDEENQEDDLGVDDEENDPCPQNQALTKQALQNVPNDLLVNSVLRNRLLKQWQEMDSLCNPLSKLKQDVPLSRISLKREESTLNPNYKQSQLPINHQIWKSSMHKVQPDMDSLMQTHDSLHNVEQKLNSSTVQIPQSTCASTIASPAVQFKPLIKQDLATWSTADLMTYLQRGELPIGGKTLPIPRSTIQNSVSISKYQNVPIISFYQGVSKVLQYRPNGANFVQTQIG